MAERYGQIVVTRHALRVDEAPEHALISVALLRQMAAEFLADRETLYIGHDPEGRPVYYRITGWDAAEKAIIVRRVDEPVVWPVG